METLLVSLVPTSVLIVLKLKKTIGVEGGKYSFNLEIMEAYEVGLPMRKELC